LSLWKQSLPLATILSFQSSNCTPSSRRSGGRHVVKLALQFVHVRIKGRVYHLDEVHLRRGEVLAQFIQYRNVVGIRAVQSPTAVKVVETKVDYYLARVGKNKKRPQSSVEQRHKFIVDCIAQEFRAEYQNIYCTAFEFMEEDQSSPSHYLLHITKSPRGFELIKQIYDKYANIHRCFDSSYVTYTYDPKKIPGMELFDEQFKQEKIDFLKLQLQIEYAGKTISARQLFKEHQKNCLYAEKHYRLALRQLSDDGHLDVAYTDCSKHRVSVKLEDYCILTFK